MALKIDVPGDAIQECVSQASKQSQSKQTTKNASQAKAKEQLKKSDTTKAKKRKCVRSPPFCRDEQD